MRSNRAIATPEYIGDVMNGRRDTIPLRDHPDPKLPLALWVDGNDHPTCHLEITACWDDGEGWTVTVRPWIFEDTPRLLRAGSPLTGGGKARLMSPRKRKFKDIRAKAPDGAKFSDDQAVGYTDRPSIALIDAGEAVAPETQAQFAQQALIRDGQRQVKQAATARRERALLTIEQRMTLARQTASTNSIDLHQEFKALRHMQRRGRSDGLVAEQLERVERIAYREAA